MNPALLADAQIKNVLSRLKDYIGETPQEYPLEVILLLRVEWDTLTSESR